MINKHLKKIRSKSEEDRIKIMWIAVAFCMLVILSGWFINFRANKNKRNFTNEISQISPFSELQKDIDGINNQKEELFEEISNIAEKVEIEIAVLDYVKESELLCANSAELCRLDLKENDLPNLELKNIEKLENNWHLEYQQYHQEVLVNNSGISFLVNDTEKKVVSHSSDFDHDVELFNTEPKITKEEAFEIAEKDLGKKTDSDDNAFDLKNSELVVYKKINKNPAEYYLTWKLNIFSLEPFCGYSYFINAENGEIVFFDETNNLKN